jgi:O-methyltransferase
MLGLSKHLYKGLHYAYHALSVPVSTACLLSSQKLDPSYGMNPARKQWLGARMMMNNILINSGTIYKLHLVMALKILETSPSVKGDIVECGTWKGGSAANLSLVCKIAGRRLKIFDSFQGLPPAKAADREGYLYKPGDYCGTLDEVKENIRKHGAIEVCDFIPGWFQDTLPKLDSPVLLAFMDVDLEDSLATCVKNLWPNLVDGGFLFTDECLNPAYISLFFSERWWKETFNCPPPGLIGGGTGLGLGNFYAGPISERDSHPLQYPGTGAYTQKNAMTGLWTFYPNEAKHPSAAVG